MTTTRDLATEEDLSKTRAAGAVDMTVLIGLLETRLFAIDKLQPEWNSALYVVANQDTLELCDCKIYTATAYPASTTSTE